MNLLLATNVELANDEAYYWWWAKGCGLDWGYFDHPPAVALLIWLTAWIPSELGVRLATSLLQPLYLYLLWRLWCSQAKDVGKTSALAFVAICFSIPLLQLYGLLALPDAPSLFCAVLFIWAVNQLWRSPSWVSASAVGLATALLGYSKYQGIIVVLTAAAVYLYASFKAKRRHAALYMLCWGAVALIFFAPHLFWLAQHDWAPLRYHLVTRSQSTYKVSFTAEYVLNFIAVFNPLLIWFIIKGYLLDRRATKADNTSLLPLLMRCVFVAYALFFLIASFRGRTQPQWCLIAAVPAVWLLMRCHESTHDSKSNKVLRIFLACSVIVMMVARLLLLFNPFGFKGEIWNNKENCEKVAMVADGRPAVMLHNYTFPCKYRFYTGCEASSVPVYYERDSQWRYADADDGYKGRDVLVLVPNWTNGELLPLNGGKDLRYRELTNYLPLRRIRIELLNGCLKGDSLVATMKVHNPYDYDICPTETNNLIWLLSEKIATANVPSCAAPVECCLPAMSDTTICCTFPLGSMSEILYQHPVSLSIGADAIMPSINSTPTLLYKQKNTVK